MRHFLIAQLDHRLSTSACVAISSLRSARHSPRRIRPMRLGHGGSPISHGKATTFSHQNPQVIDRSFFSASTVKNPLATNPPKIGVFRSRLPGLAFGNSRCSCPKGKPHELIKLLKYARDQRRSVSIHAQFLALVSLFGDWFLLRHHGCCKAGRTPITKIDNEHNILALCAMPRGFFRATAAIFTRKCTIFFDLTHMLKTASCRPCCLN